MIDYRQFMRDAERTLHEAMVHDTRPLEPVCYMGDKAFTELLSSVGAPFGTCDVRERRVGGIQVYVVREHRDHYHMTYRRKR